jgi:hypothetical protein
LREITNEVKTMAVLNSQLSTLNSQDSLAPAAYTGLPGDIVHALSPHTEADPVALLLSLLVAFGNFIGRGPHFAAEAVRHHLNLCCVLVGPTADARKGASWCQIRRIFETVDLEWAAWCVRRGHRFTAFNAFNTYDSRTPTLTVRLSASGGLARNTGTVPGFAAGLPIRCELLRNPGAVPALRLPRPWPFSTFHYLLSTLTPPPTPCAC